MSRIVVNYDEGCARYSLPFSVRDGRKLKLSAIAVLQSISSASAIASRQTTFFRNAIVRFIPFQIGQQGRLMFLLPLCASFCFFWSPSG